MRPQGRSRGKSGVEGGQECDDDDKEDDEESFQKVSGRHGK